MKNIALLALALHILCQPPMANAQNDQWYNHLLCKIFCYGWVGLALGVFVFGAVGIEVMDGRKELEYLLPVGAVSGGLAGVLAACCCGGKRNYRAKANRPGVARAEDMALPEIAQRDQVGTGADS